MRGALFQSSSVVVTGFCSAEGDKLFCWWQRDGDGFGGCEWMMDGREGKGDEERGRVKRMGRLMIATVPLLVSQAAHCGLALFWSALLSALLSRERAGHGSARRREFRLTRLLRLACEVVPVQGTPTHGPTCRKGTRWEVRTFFLPRD